MKIAYCGPISINLLSSCLSKKHGLNGGYSYPFGAHYVNELLCRGHQVHVVTNTKNTRTLIEYHKDNLSIYVTPRRKTTQCVFDCYRAEREAMTLCLRNIKPDIVHSQWSYEFCHAAQSSGFVNVVTIRDSPWKVFFRTRSAYRLFRAFYSYHALKGVENIVSVSPYILSTLPAKSSAKSIVIPNGISENSLHFQGERVVDKISPQIICISSWTALKNCKAALQSFSYLRIKYPNANLILVGPLLQKNGPAHQWARKKRLHSNVEFIGKVSHDELISLMLNHSDILLYPSLEESFCMVALEAMACGLPIVVCPGSGALPWLVDYGKSGIIASDSTPRALCSATQKLIENPDLYSRIRANALQRANQNFTMEKSVDSYLSLFEKLC